ncbi:serine--tRNA ligase [Candidatus Methanoliparum sp. LAM-1]|uniref:serine--tRNA ligase n=1 Tax=Candidatus Methanoliparum sp. LAM-1 TaxID=2874846 RepID=UPI001E3A8A26|nr:serine--tRNA ligase [Candidatus Methanoliparum sp. LAM-1]BDC36579.1 serine--tRNA ligase [Candidatus Methanoliparum sp. LAM-1]
MNDLEFHLKGTIKTNRNVEHAKEDIYNLIKEANESLLVKGAPKGKGAKVSNINVSNDKISLEIFSDRYVRAHDALIRLYNPLRKLLGKKYQIGLRGISTEYYCIKLDKNVDLDDIKIVLNDIPEIKDVNNNEGKIEIYLKELSESDLRSHSIDRIIGLLKDESLKTADKDYLVYKIAKIEPGTILYRCKNRVKLALDRDPTEIAEEIGWIKRFPGKGQWIYLPPYAKLFRAISDIIVEEVPEKLGFSEALFPKLIPLEIMKKMRYLEGLPEGMYYVSSPKRDPNIYERFKKELAIRDEIPIEILKEGLKDPSYVLAPAQCEPFYQIFSHEMVDLDELPIKMFDRSGFTYRWEGGATKGLDRVNEFQRIEMVFLGTLDQVKEIADDCLKAYMDVMDLMGLNWHVEVGDDPFYLEGLREEKRDIEYPEIPKFEVRVETVGGRTVSIGSVNLHGTHFVTGFSIRSPKPIWTGCIGFGISRWVAVFLSHYGFDIEKWPSIIKERVRELPKVTKTLEWPKKR